jgi:hypothetical protein
MDDKRINLHEDVVTQLEKEAGRRGMSLHDSFKIELVNYSRHVEVEDLPAGQLNLVLIEIGKAAIRRAGEQARVGTHEVPGEDVRMAITMLCTAFSHCYKAAEHILESKKTAKV